MKALLIIFLSVGSVEAGVFKAVPAKFPVSRVPVLALPISVMPSLSVLPELEPSLGLPVPKMAVLPETVSGAIAPIAPGIVHAQPERRPRRARPRPLKALPSLQAVDEISREFPDLSNSEASAALSFAFDEARNLRP